MKRLLALGSIAMALGAEVASAQDAGEAFAAYALDFCAAVVDGQSPETAHAAAAPGATLVGPRPAGESLDSVTRVLKGDADTSIYVLGPPDDNPETLMAFARADAQGCMAYTDRDDGSLAAVYRRLDGEAGPWQRQMGRAAIALFKRNASDGAGGIDLFTVATDGKSLARVIVERSDGTITFLTLDQRTAWAATLVSQCAAGVHQGVPLAAEAFVPFFKVADKQADSLTLDETPGNPGGMLFLNSGNTCSAAIATGGVPDLERALREALVASGATEQRDGSYRLPKPRDARGRDAIMHVDTEAGPLLFTVRRR